MLKFFHHLFNPHCPDCRLEKECNTCDTLRSLLESERFEKNKLLQQIIQLTTPRVEDKIESEVKIPQILKPSYSSWRVKQQELEANDRKQARILKERKEAGLDKEVIFTQKDLAPPSVEELEKQLDIEDKNAS